MRARWFAPRTGSSAARRARTRRSISGRTGPSTSSSTSSKPGSSSAARSPARRSSRRARRTELRLARGDEPGRVAVTDLLRARTRRTEVVFLLGLEEGSLPRRQQGTPFLDEEERRSIDESSRRSRLAKPDQVSRERYFFYTACTRPSRRLYLVREASTDEGSPREPSPFWDEARALFDAADVERWTTRRRLGAADLGRRRGADRTRAAARPELARAESSDEAVALANANGWERRLSRALGAFSRPTKLTDQALIDSLRAKATFSVTELELFADCSSIWFLER